jgi:general secretion pathway protein E
MTQTLPDLLNASLIVQKKRLIPYKVALGAKCLPFEEDSFEIQVAYCDSYPFEALDTIAVLFKKKITPFLVGEELLLKALELCYQSSDKETQNLIETANKNNAIESSESQDGHDLLDESESNPVIRIVNAIFSEAIKMGASDIHFEPSEKGLSVRYRVDGVLLLRHTPAKEIESQIIARLKVLAQLDIAESRLPQDGRLKLKINKRSVDFRVSVIPVAFGERIVLRILDKSHLSLSLDRLGIPSDILESIHQAINVPEGMLLVTGPTGSGKTTTLYSALNKLLQDPINIMTIEDPVEYRFSGMAQISVNSKINLSFASGLKHILRQDPDVILVGELRDIETFEAAVHAAETGHLVFGTIHAASASTTINRILDLFPPEKHGAIRQALANNLRAIVAQKLLKSIRPGVSRVPTNEIMICNAIVRKLISEGRDNSLADAIRMCQQEGMMDFTESLRQLVDRGDIDKATALEVAPNPDQLKMALKGIKVATPGIL